MVKKSRSDLSFLPKDYPEPESCTCETCQDMCSRPCWPTPEEAKRIMGKFPGKMMMEYWSSFEEHGDILLVVPAGKGYEHNTHPPFWPDYKSCAFFINGLCQLHDLGLKPTEGRLAHHNRMDDPVSIHEAVAATWDNDEAQAWAEEIREKWEEE